MDQPSSVESSITFKEAEMQLHQVDLGAHKLQIYLPKSRTKMLAEAQTEENDLPYWAFFWPPAVGLGRLLACEPLLEDRTLVELGAGSAVAGLAAALAKAKVTLTDYIADSIALCAYNATKNNLVASYLQADWKNLSEWPKGFDVVIGSEVLYEPEAAETIVALLASPVLRPGGLFVIIDPGRPFISLFVRRLEENGFCVERTHIHFETIEGPQESTLITGIKAKDDSDALLRAIRQRAASMKSPEEQSLPIAAARAPPPPPPPPLPPADFWCSRTS